MFLQLRLFLHVDAHDWLLSPAVDILPCLLLPLAGPEEFDDDEMDKLPPELQYLEPEKSREPIAAIRANLLEALTQVRIRIRYHYNKPVTDSTVSYGSFHSSWS